jgi:GNAT superfamily N-acetyltransferase
MIVRQLKKSDAKAASNLIIRCLREINSQFYPKRVIKKMEKLYTPDHIINFAKDRLFLVAEDLNEEIIGTATISENMFGSVFISPDHQRQGIGAKVMQSLEELVKAQGKNEVILHASINAVQFYEKQGYKEIKRVEDEKFGNSIEMRKQL